MSVATMLTMADMVILSTQFPPVSTSVNNRGCVANVEQYRGNNDEQRCSFNIIVSGREERNCNSLTFINKLSYL